MADAGTLAADKAQAEIEKRLQNIYSTAAKDIDRKIRDFNKKHRIKDKLMRADLKAGKISPAQYQNWLAGQVFIGKQWQDKKDSIATTLLYANQQANAIVEGKKRAVFGANATYQAYALENGLHMDVSFSVYDSATVTRLLKEQPELLPRREVNGKKDKAWNRTKISTALTQGIIQGEGIDDIAKRIAKATAQSNMVAMTRYARTAMTSAQNAGRIEAMHAAQDMGIQVKKQWIATLDAKTRDAHQELDGQVQDVDKPFKSELGDIMYPADPAAAPANVYNCRCTLGYVYPEYPFAATQRKDNITKDVIPDMTYNEWLSIKDDAHKSEFYLAKEQLNNLTNECILNNANKVFSGIWLDDVTYKDWPDKKDSIPKKRQYYEDRIQMYDAKLANNPNDAFYNSMRDDFKRKLALLDEFEQHGAANYQLLMDRDAALKEFRDKLPKPQPKKKRSKASNGADPFTPDAYTKARKDAAMWTTDKAYVDTQLRDTTGAVWKAATNDERAAIYDYTQSYHKFNEPLRGVEYGSNRYLGVGNTDLDAGYQHNGKALNAMTSIIDKTSYDKDMWLQRGCRFDGMDKFFQIDSDTLQYGTQDTLENALLGKTVTEYGFMSCGTAKGQGFSAHPIILNVYAPSGTKMIYSEPFSHYGAEQYESRYGFGVSWDGAKKQKNFGDEFETILQQNTQMRITKVEVHKDPWGSGENEKIFVDLEVIGQSEPQLYKP